MKRDATMPLMELAANGEALGSAATGGVVREGFFWCEHCRKVVDELSQREIDAALSAPAGSLVKLKCPGCHHHEVRWRDPSPARAIGYDNRPIKDPPKPVSVERGKELFARVRAGLANELGDEPHS